MNMVAVWPEKNRSRVGAWPVAISSTTGSRSNSICAGGSSGSRSEEHTSELQSLMRISYAVFCLKKKKKKNTKQQKETEDCNTRTTQDIQRPKQIYNRRRKKQ